MACNGRSWEVQWEHSAQRSGLQRGRARGLPGGVRRAAERDARSRPRALGVARRCRRRRRRRHVIPPAASRQRDARAAAAAAARPHRARSLRSAPRNGFHQSLGIPCGILVRIPPGGRTQGHVSHVRAAAAYHLVGSASPHFGFTPALTSTNHWYNRPYRPPTPNWNACDEGQPTDQQHQQHTNNCGIPRRAKLGFCDQPRGRAGRGA